MNSREKIVLAAFDLFCSRGFNAVGTDEICKKAGVFKGTLYHFFPSKFDVALAALEYYGERVRDGIRAAITRGRKPETRLMLVFLGSRQSAQSQKDHHGMVCGCLHGNLALELAAVDERIRLELERITDSWVELLVPVIEELVANKTIPPCQPNQAARTILALLHGAMLMAKTANEPSFLISMGRSVIRLLGGTKLAPHVA